MAIRDLLDEEADMVREKVQFIFAVGKSVIGLVHQGSEEEAPSSDSDRGNSNQRQQSGSRRDRGGRRGPHRGRSADASARRGQ